MNLLCKIFGHKWELKRLPYLSRVKRGDQDDGIFREVISFESVKYQDKPNKVCFRCGTISH